MCQGQIRADRTPRSLLRNVAGMSLLQTRDGWPALSIRPPHHHRCSQIPPVEADVSPRLANLRYSERAALGLIETCGSYASLRHVATFSNTGLQPSATAKVTQASCLTRLAGFPTCELRQLPDKPPCLSKETGWKPVLLLKTAPPDALSGENAGCQ